MHEYTHRALQDLRSLQKKIVMNISFCLMTALIIFIIGVEATGETRLCHISGMLLHYFLLASFAWMLVDGMHLFHSIVIVFPSGEYPWSHYCVVGYIVPLVIVALTAVTHKGRYNTEELCWLSSSNGSIYFFTVPITLVITINCYYLWRIMRVITKMSGKFLTRVSEKNL